MISAISWVPKGIARAIPAEVEPPTKEEIEEIIKSGTLDRSDDSENEDNDEMDLDAAKRAGDISQALAAAKALDMTPKTTTFGTKDMTDALKELNMDNYDEEDDGIEIFSTAIGDRYYPSNEMDPYLKKDDEDDDDDEIEDMTIKATDAVCVFEELEDGEFNFYSHHDIILPAFPLCTAWLDFDVKKTGGDKGNFVAAGTMEPAIEIWDLDLIDELQPCLVLGGVAKKKKKGKKKGIDYQKGSHTDSVLGLDWNKKEKKYLASASADNSVKIWDIEAGK
ncbi:hypothetical protein C5167_042126 [Papaver somniferum]|nr:hypothetical protein C5167_042126 [Papaver somniferum]